MCVSARREMLSSQFLSIQHVLFIGSILENIYIYTCAKKHFEWSSLFQNKQFHTCLRVWTWQTITNHPPSNRNLPIPDNPLAHPFQTCDPRCGEVGPMTWISRHPRKHSRLEVILRVASLGCSKLLLLLPDNIEMDSTAEGICNYKQYYNMSSGKFKLAIMLILPIVSKATSIF